MDIKHRPYIKVKKNSRLRKNPLMLVWNPYGFSWYTLFSSYNIKVRPSAKFNYYSNKDSWDMILNDINATLCMQHTPWGNHWMPYAFLFDTMQHKMIYILKHPERL